MRKRTTMSRVLGVLLSCVMVLTMAQIPSMAVHAEEGGVGGFVNRCYQVALGRAADASGYADWTNQLTSGQSDGAYVAFGFVFSPEYTNSGKNNEAFVTDMYTLFLGRTPDEAGYRDWVGQLNNGADRQAIFAGFANSNEFYNICTSYGITAGVHVPGYDRTQVNNVNMFVARMYRVCLNRLGDKDGQNDWVNRLLHGELSGTDCAHGFIYSKEYQNLGLSNEAYVENLYATFMGRHSDPTGFNDWVSKLNAGYTRDEIFAGFANSNEFQNICNSYGIVRGTYTPTNVHSGDITPTPTPTPTPAPEPQVDNPVVKTQGWRLKKETDPSGNYIVYSYTANTNVDYVADSYRSNNSKVGTLLKSSFDKNANRVSGEVYYYEGNSNSSTGGYRYETTYKSLGGSKYEANQVEKAQSGAVTGYYKICYHKLANGKYLIDSESEYDSNNKLSYTKTYSYYSDNRVKQVVFTDESNNVSEKDEYTYNNGTQTLVETRYKSGGKGISLIRKRVTTYDANGNEKTVTQYDSTDKVSYTMTYDYDQYGNRTKQTQKIGGVTYVTSYQYEQY